MKIPAFLFAPLVVAFFLGTILIGRNWELPSMQREFSSAAGTTRTAELIVQGLRCRGTANFFMKRIEKIPGIVAVATYVQEHRAVIEYDPSEIDEETIISKIEAPVRLRNGKVVKPFKVTEILN